MNDAEVEDNVFIRDYRVDIPLNLLKESLKSDE